MEIGDKEWFEELNKRTSFPETFAFYYNKRDNAIQVSIVESKAKVENIRYSAIAPSPLLFHPKETALIKLKTIFSDTEYLENLKHLTEVWGTKL